MTDAIRALSCALQQQGFPPARVTPDAPMRTLTTFHIGGPADLLCDAVSPDEVRCALLSAHRFSVPVTVIGNGSNLLVRDGGIRGLVLRLTASAQSPLVLSEDSRSVWLRCYAGISLAALSAFACQLGLSGMAELSGIPGTLGGGVIMNAGAYGAELSGVVRSVRALRMTDVSPCVFEGDALGFGYRRSAMAGADVLVTEADLCLPRGDAEQIRTRMRELAAARREKQPLDLPSAGSTFKRPAGGFAAKMIDECGLRGTCIGGAQVSEKHAGFIVNRGGASAADVLRLMALVRGRVAERFGVTLEPEIRILGEDA